MGNQCPTGLKPYQFSKYKNGCLLYTVPIVDGRKQGVQYNYDQKGQLQSAITYDKGVFHGVFSIFDEKKQKKMRVMFREGVKHGFEFHFKKDLLIHFVRVFCKNEVVYHRSFCKSDPIEECCVCFENTNLMTSCGHIVCPDCIEKVDRCPICRQFLRETLLCI